MSWDKRIRWINGMAFGCALAACAGSAMAQANVRSAPSTSAYSCIDAQGRKLTSDRLIAACMDREQREIMPGGIVRIIPPRATADELRAQEEAQRLELEKRRAEQRERAAQRALLARYPDRASFDAARAEALKLHEGAIQAAHARIEELKAERKKLDEEMEFYVKDPSRAPVALRRMLDANESALAAQRLAIKNQMAESDRIRAKFDQELKKLQTLWR